MDDCSVDVTDEIIKFSRKIDMSVINDAKDNTKETDAIIFLKQCDANNKCIINKNDGKLVAELTKNILSKAARLQKAKIDKNKKENPYVMGTPGS